MRVVAGRAVGGEGGVDLSADWRIRNGEREKKGKKDKQETVWNCS